MLITHSYTLEEKQRHLNWSQSRKDRNPKPFFIWNWIEFSTSQEESNELNQAESFILWTAILFCTWDSVLEEFVNSPISRCNEDGKHGCRHPKLQHNSQYSFLVLLSQILLIHAKKKNQFSHSLQSEFKP